LALIFEDKGKTYSDRRIQKIRGYAARQMQRIEAEKENDFQNVDEHQQEWFDGRMMGNARRWEVWDSDQVREEWEPWNRFGEPFNKWRYHKK
jgi:hypothetical protein